MIGDYVKWAMLILSFIMLGIDLERWGKVREVRKYGWVEFIGSLISIAIWTTLIMGW